MNFLRADRMTRISKTFFSENRFPNYKYIEQMYRQLRSKLRYLFKFLTYDKSYSAGAQGSCQLPKIHIPQQYSVLCLSAYKFRFIDKAYLKVNDKVPNHVKCVITGLFY